MRTEDDLRDVMRELGRDVTPPDELLALPAPTRRNASRALPFAVTAAVAVVLIAVVTTLATHSRSRESSPVEPVRPSVPTTATTVTPIASRPAVPSNAATGTAVPTSVASRAVPPGWRTIDGFYYPPTWMARRAEVPSRSLTQRLVRFSYRSPGAPLPADGIVIHWIEVPSAAGGLDNSLGRATTIDGHPAKVYSGPKTCGRGGNALISATIAVRTRQNQAGDNLRMTACLGPRVPTSERANVYTMLATVHVRS